MVRWEAAPSKWLALNIERGLSYSTRDLELFLATASALAVWAVCATGATPKMVATTRLTAARSVVERAIPRRGRTTTANTLTNANQIRNVSHENSYIVSVGDSCSSNRATFKYPSLLETGFPESSKREGLISNSYWNVPTWASCKSRLVESCLAL